MFVYLLKRYERPSDRDEMYGAVVIAESQAEARKLVAKQHGDEDSGAWYDRDRSGCFVLGDAMAGLEAGVQLRDFFAG